MMPGKVNPVIPEVVNRIPKENRPTNMPLEPFRTGTDLERTPCRRAGAYPARRRFQPGTSARDVREPISHNKPAT